MAETKDPKKDSAEGIQQNLLAGKYKTPDDLAAAYTELEKKLGEMGTKHQEELARIQALADQYKAPAEWAQQHGQRLVQEHQQLVAAFQQMQQQRPNGQAQANGADPLAWLTQPERDALYTQFAQRYHQQVMQPFANQYAQQQLIPYIQQQLKSATEPVMAQQRAALELLWGAIESAAPEDKLAQIKQQQQLMLKYSDPKTYDPRNFAAEDMKRESELLKRQARIEELEKQIQAREQRETAPVAASGGVSPFKKEGEKPAPKTRDERLRTVVDKVREQVGPEQFREAFPATA